MLNKEMILHLVPRKICDKYIAINYKTNSIFEIDTDVAAVLWQIKGVEMDETLILASSDLDFELRKTIENKLISIEDM